MKLKSDCIPCLIERTKYGYDMLFFDGFVIKELLKRGKGVIVSPRSAPVINDAKIGDLKEASISSSEAGFKKDENAK